MGRLSASRDPVQHGAPNSLPGTLGRANPPTHRVSIDAARSDDRLIPLPKSSFVVRQQPWPV